MPAPLPALPRPWTLHPHGNCKAGSILEHVDGFSQWGGWTGAMLALQFKVGLTSREESKSVLDLKEKGG